MPIIRLVPVFEKSRDKFVKKDLKLAIKIRHTLERFATNPQHPSLHLEKLSGTDVWTIRIDRGNRFFLSGMTKEILQFSSMSANTTYTEIFSGWITTLFYPTLFVVYSSI